MEVDETYVGGKLRVGPQSLKQGERPKDPLAASSNKAAVASALQRGGRVQSIHVERATAANPKPIIEQMVDESAHMITDSSTVLRWSSEGRRHSKVNHDAKEYVRFEGGLCITTDAVEGHFGNLKRGINGVCHHVGRHHLHRDLSEFAFRYNAREVSDKERAKLALRGTSGKRLMYRDSCAKER